MALNIVVDELSRNLYHTVSPIKLYDVIHRSTVLHDEAIWLLLNQTGYASSSVDVIGYHGQTLYHSPYEKISVSIGDGQWLANQTGVPVIHDFRSADVRAGGQGAPFAPLYHQALLANIGITSAAFVNCGGLSNVTYISTDDPLNGLLAFDTGPGNVLIDRFVRARTKGREHMDKDGNYGAKGVVSEEVLNKLFEKSIVYGEESFFAKKPPKSLDSGHVHLIPELDALSLEDGAATLEAFTAESLVRSLDWVDSKKWPHLWITAGGGFKNKTIVLELEERLTRKLGDKVEIKSADEMGFCSQSLEAEIFAYLAVRSLLGLPLSLPSTTAVPEPQNGGVLYMPEAYRRVAL
jgi:anhydro-N-acetylmuramic acid kinase